MTAIILQKRAVLPFNSRRGLLAVLLALLLSLPTLSGSLADSAKPIELKIVGGLGGLKLYTQYESPFWTETITTTSEGRIKASIHPFDKSGLRGEEMLQLMQMGVVPFGTALLGLVAGDEPELNGIYLGNLGTSSKSLRSTVEKYRPHIANLLRQRYGIELLAIYAYPDQVVFCRQAFSNLEDLAGRRIRTSHVSQSDLMSELGATPVVLPFQETLRAIKRGDVDCAITGTSGGNQAELFKITTHISEMGLTPGLSIFAVNSLAWSALPQDVRDLITRVCEGSGRTDLDCIRTGYRKRAGLQYWPQRLCGWQARLDDSCRGKGIRPESAPKATGDTPSAGLGGALWCELCQCLEPVDG